jgi:hypothetical protein
VESFDVPKADHTKGVWDVGQVKAFLEHVAEDPWYGGWVLSAHGLRLGEVAGLRWEDVTFHEEGTGLVCVARNRTAVGGVIHEGTPRTTSPGPAHRPGGGGGVADDAQEADGDAGEGRPGSCRNVGGSGVERPRSELDIATRCSVLIHLADRSKR